MHGIDDENKTYRYNSEIETSGIGSSIGRIYKPILETTDLCYNSSKNVLLQLPFAVVQRTHIPRLEPSGNTVEVEGVLRNTWVCGACNIVVGRHTLHIPHAALHSSLVADT